MKFKQPFEQSEAREETEGSVWELLLFTVFFVVVFSAIARADESAPQAASKTKVALIKPVEFKMVGSIERLNSLYVTETDDDVSRMEIALRPSLTFKETWAVGALIEGVQDQKAEKFDYGRGQLSGAYTKGINLIGKRIKMVPSLGVGFPISEEAKLASMKAVGIVGTKFELNQDYFYFKKLSTTIGLNAGQYFHDYETTNSGEVNTQNFSTQVLTLGWEFSDAFSTSVEFVHYDAFSYHGNHSDFIGHREEINYAINKTVALGIGHQWGDPYTSTLKSNGQDFSLAATDDKSLVFGNLTITL
jgi:hypothetical protein